MLDPLGKDPTMLSSGSVFRLKSHISKSPSFAAARRPDLLDSSETPAQTSQVWGWHQLEPRYSFPMVSALNPESPEPEKTLSPDNPRNPKP